MPVALSLFLVLFFLLMNAFFVAAEFSLVRVRKSQVEILVDEDRSGAKYTKLVADNVNAYLSACQLGITLASLALGWLGEPAVSQLIEGPLLAIGLPEAAIHGIAIAIGFVVITALHIVVGELIPKSLAIFSTERYALFTATPLVWFYRITYPIMWLFNSITNGVMKLLGHDIANEHEVYTEDVYKRQALDFLRLAQVRGLGVWMGGMYDTGVSKRLHAAFETLPGIDAVSYTHLDVYKRQVRCGIP